jgi:glycosyltransferase involved in cell wall biosynthesis
LVYYSLELLLSHEVSNPADKRCKEREISLSRKARFVIIQDEERARLLAQDNQIPIEKFALVPNSPLGTGRRKRSRYWHQRFALSSDPHVVLHAGSIARWTGIEEIVRSVGYWPEDWILVVHSRSNAESSELVERLRELAVPGRVFFSLQPVTTQEYDMLVDGADIGIAFYVSTGDSTYTGQNVQSLGLSSGKIADYLRAGLPVIVNQAGSISELLRRERCGIAVEKGRDIGRAIGQIAQQYEDYSRRACQVFEDYLDFSRGFQEVIRRIDSLEEERNASD